MVKTIGEVWALNLRNLRGKKTQAAVAEAADVSLRAYSDMEAGHLPKSQTTIAAIAKALSCTESVLFQDPDIKPVAVPDQLAAIARQAAREAIQEANRDTSALTARIAELEAEIARMKAEKDDPPQVAHVTPLRQISDPWILRFAEKLERLNLHNADKCTLEDVASTVPEKAATVERPAEKKSKS